MKVIVCLLLQAIFLLPISSLAADGGIIPLREDQAKRKISDTRKAGLTRSYGELPLYFTENRGQVESSVVFYERGAGHATFFTRDGLVLALTRGMDGMKKHSSPAGAGRMEAGTDKKAETEVVRLSFVGADKDTRIAAGSKMPGQVNYFVGSDRSKWRSGIPTYGEITFKDLYSNIDVTFYGSNRNLEHDVIVRPGGDFSEVKFAYRGIEGLELTPEGDLEVILSSGRLIEKRPVIYQEIDGRRVPVKGSYKLLGEKDGAFAYGFSIASYDHTRDLVIDPVLAYSTYLGGLYDDVGFAIAVDSAGAAYLTGFTASTDFPLAAPLQAAIGASVDIFVTKINPAGTAMVYSTYLGGNNTEIGYGIAVDSTGAAYVTGTTSSTDFPLLSPIQGAIAGFSDVFVAKINAAGSSLVYSTYLGGSMTDEGSAIAVDSTGAAYVTGYTGSTNFPTASPIQGAHGGSFWDAFVTKINPAGSLYAYSTYLGGSGYDEALGIAVDSSGAAYVTGWTYSTDFPLMNPIQPLKAGATNLSDAFVTKINAAGSSLVYSTYLGGANDEQALGIAVDSTGAAYVTGYTNSADYPVANPIQAVNAGGFGDAFVTKINAAGSAHVYSTYLGGTGYDQAYGIAVDSTGAAYVTGNTYSTDFPLAAQIQGYMGGIGELMSDAFVTKINPAGSAYGYSTYLGGATSEDWGFAIAVTGSGAAYVTGHTYSTDFPLMNPIQGVKGGGAYDFDAFVTKIDVPLPVVTLAVTPDAASVFLGSALGYTVTAANTTALRQCFNYWENVTLPDGTLFPPTGSLMKPIRLCLAGGASKVIHLAHGIPPGAVTGAYVFNSYCGADTRPTPIIVDEAHFGFDVTTPLSPVRNPRTSW